MTNWADLPLTPEHAAYLEAAAISPEVVECVGVYSATEPGNVPPELQAVAPLPAIVFPWRSPTGVVEYQVRPDSPSVDERGRPRKYLWRQGMVPVLGRVVEDPDASTVWVVEGTKQALAAGSYASAGVEVYGIGGCRMWMHDGAPIRDLQVVEDRDVIVIFDADAAGNREVYDAGMNLADALRVEGARSVLFARLLGGKTAGLDDVLGGRDPDKRAAYLARMVTDAKSKPANARPKAKPHNTDDVEQTAEAGRPVIVVNRDRFQVISELSEALRAKWDATRMFNHGGVLGWLERHELVVVDQGKFLDLVAQTARCVSEGEKNGVVVYTDAWPDSYTIKAVFARADKFAPIERVSRSPFVRPDGSICQTPGYDEQTRTVLVPDTGLDEIEIPDDPTADEVAVALSFLRDEWLGDMPLPENADRANALALVLTPLIRGLVPRVPLAVIDGLQMGVGKNLLADCLAMFITRDVVDPKSYTATDEDEQRKFITAAFRSGDELFIFDEAHELAGNALARALTSIVYSDRILGVSTVAKFPNRVTWVSLGNNVQVRGDMARRVYRIRLAPAVDNPQDRPPESFRHPDLLGWTREHRAELLRAALTLVRAWFAAGQPPSVRGASFGSFEAWGRMVGGILENAGQAGFLDNLVTWRSESDFDTRYWAAHLTWLREQFGAEEFTAGQVRGKAISDSSYAAPPRLDDPSDKSYAKALGEAYAKVRGRSYDGYRIRRHYDTHHKIARWGVDIPETGLNGVGGPPASADSDNPDNKGTELRGLRGPAGTSNLYTCRNTYPYGRAGEGICDSAYRGERGSLQVPAVPATPGPVVFDLETGPADDLHRAGPGFVRLAGYCGDGPTRITADVGELVGRLDVATLVTGHNILGFDLLALSKYHGVDVPALVDRGVVFDALLAARHADPPPARYRRKYDLDALAGRLGLDGKSGDLKALAKEFGGYDRIPLDDPRYREYLMRDVRLSAELFVRYSPLRDDPYLAREHKVAAIAAQITLNGFAVDEDLLATRLAEGDARKSAALDELSATYGVPLVDDKGRRRKSPVAAKAGKEAIERAFLDLGVPAANLPRTDKARDLMTSGDAMAVVKAMHGHRPEVARLCELVAAVTSERTIYQTISAHVVNGRVYPTVSMEQSTGRWSISKPGMTVVGKRGGRHVEREVFLPDPGHVIISIDLAQVDARAVAALSGDRAYAALFAPGVDAHAEVARRVWGDVSRREDAKPLGHGWNYGMGLEKLSKTASVPYETAQQFDDAMRYQFPRLVAWRDQVREIARSGELLDNGFGRRMRPDPDRAHTQGPAFMGQGCARDLMMAGLLRLPRAVYPYLRAVVHDEVVLSVPAEDADDIERAVVDALSFEWRGVPIIAETQMRTVDGRKVPARGASWGAVYAKRG